MAQFWDDTHGDKDDDLPFEIAVFYSKVLSNQMASMYPPTSIAMESINIHKGYWETILTLILSTILALVYWRV